MSIHEERLYQLVGKRVKAQRTALTWTQTDLAKSVGLRRTSIANIEAGRQKSPLAVLYRIGFALDIDISSLLPPLEDVLRSESSAIPIRGDVREVPPLAAEVLQEILDEDQEERKGTE